MSTTFRQLLDKFEGAAKTRVAKGRRFEEFCEQFFRVDRYWEGQFERVWSWMDWPGRGGRPDTGIDLVASERGTGNLVAIQCKFYAPSATLRWDQVSTFMAKLAQAEFSSGLIVSTAGRLSPNLIEDLDRASKPVNLWQVEDFELSSVDWDQFDIDRPTQLELLEPKALREHQRRAIDDTLAGFVEHERGQLIMACGTGKTFTSLRLAEQLVGAGGRVLFLVPSINLLSQSVKAWANDATASLATFAVCSDIRAGQRRADEDMSPNDLSFPASTDPEALLTAVLARSDAESMTVVFSTYQSIDVISRAQQDGLGAFNLVICDEAHRTTGAFKEDDETPFTKVHDNANVSANKRLYMTATPRVYGDQAKRKATDAGDVVLASMDDHSRFGPVFHELKFGEAVRQALLTDYKVLVLAVDEDAVSEAFQRHLSVDGELRLDDYARIVGCWHGLSKRGPQFVDDNEPMQRAVAFCGTIKQSKRFTDAFPAVVNAVLENRADPNAVKIETQHVDGTTNVKIRSEAIAWLEEPPGQRVCRVLSNAKCLTEGVDVPALDSVMFLSPRKSIVDVVQAVGRVMRLSPGKDFGYVILPIGVPSGVPPEEALRDNKRYEVVWQVLQALRSHDERLAAEINKIDINRSSARVSVIGIGMGGGADPDDGSRVTTQRDPQPGKLELPDLTKWRDALYARIVERVGDRKYMEHWARDIQQIAAAQETRIRTLLDKPNLDPAAAARFDEFHLALKSNLNDSITRDQAIGMLSQHLITRPVFEALFADADFTHRNPVSAVMQGMLDVLDGHSVATEAATLEGFYEHIRMLLGDIHTTDGRQHVITRLYEEFFKRALPKESSALGIVYTPVEVVDFINRSVNDLLIEHFGADLSSEGVHILDPFTGTGTFITRLMQTGLIKVDALPRKYARELHANELMLLAYYIATINIEGTYHSTLGADAYEPFDGIVLTDTFQMAEGDDTLDTVLFPVNNDRAERQKALDIRVIIGNPPYSVGQTSQSDNNANFSYQDLDRAIADTYIARAEGNPTSLYDSYIRALRWASNRITESPSGGVIGFVTNGGWIDGRAASGVRRSLALEFHDVYVFNLRGNTRTSGEVARREGGQVFGPGSRNTVAITLLVRRREPLGRCSIHYRDIGDYLDRTAKLSIVDASTLSGEGWLEIEPNAAGDWVNKRSGGYDRLVPLAGEHDAVFLTPSTGLKTSRDAWSFNSSADVLRSNMSRTVTWFNAEVSRLAALPAPPTETLGARAERFRAAARFDETNFSWNYGDFDRAARGEHYRLDESMLRTSTYRPFFRQMVAFDRALVRSPSQMPKMFPPSARNVGITPLGRGARSDFCAFAVDTITSLHLIGPDATNFYGRWVYAERGGGLLDAGVDRTSNINPVALGRWRSLYGDDLDDDAVFAFVYGILHSRSFIDTFQTSLKKEATRIPLVADRELFDAFRSAGQQLLDLHIGYEGVDPYPLVEEWAAGADPDSTPAVLLVGPRKMRHPKITVDGEKVDDRSRLIYNDHLTLSGIPVAAYRYEVGTRSAIGWLIDRYYVSIDKASGIVNDPNQWGLERGEPRYIIDLVKRVVTVSIRTVEIVDALPRLTFGPDGVASIPGAPTSRVERMTFEAAAQQLDISLPFLERLVTSGKIGTIAGDTHSVSALDVRRFAEQRRRRREAADEALDALLDAGVEY